MDLSKLDQNERMAAIAAVVLIVAGLLAVFGFSTYAVTWIPILAAIGMLAVLFAPQVAPSTTLPGSRGSLLVITGGVAALFMVLAFLANISFTFFRFGISDLFFLVAVAAGLAMGWFGWQAFQAEGGKLQLGSASSGDAAATPPAASSGDAATPPPAAASGAQPGPAAPAAAPPPAAADPAASDAADEHEHAGHDHAGHEHEHGEDEPPRQA